MCLKIELGKRQARKLKREIDEANGGIHQPIRNNDGFPSFLRAHYESETTLDILDKTLSKFIKVATDDIKVYKAVVAQEKRYTDMNNGDTVTKYKTLYHGSDIDRNAIMSDEGKRMEVFRSSRNGRTYLDVMGGMFHSFRSKKDAMDAVNGYNKLYDSWCCTPYSIIDEKNLCGAYEYATIFEAVIPKGTEYIEGEFELGDNNLVQAICSKKIMYTKVLTEDIANECPIRKNATPILPSFDETHSKIDEGEEYIKFNFSSHDAKMDAMTFPYVVETIDKTVGNQKIDTKYIHPKHSLTSYVDKVETIDNTSLFLPL